MKLTESTLRKIVREEIRNVVEDARYGAGGMVSAEGEVEHHEVENIKSDAADYHPILDVEVYRQGDDFEIGTVRDYTTGEELTPGPDYDPEDVRDRIEAGVTKRINLDF